MKHWLKFINIDKEGKVLNVNRAIKQAKALCIKEYNITTKPNSNETIKFFKSFQGLDINEIKTLFEKFNNNIDLYDYDEKTKLYDLHDQIHFSDDFKTYSLLLISNNNNIHISIITKSDVLTNILIGPKCHSFTYRKNWCRNDRFQKHVDNCDEKFKKTPLFKLSKLPYIRHILNNSAYEYCLAHNFKYKLLNTLLHLIFKRLRKKINDKITDSTTINSNLFPLSVSTTIYYKNGNNIKTLSLNHKFYYEM
ncbi:hypothetical protein TRFO_35574 [Tritrichomonas foetus]|uniref:Uncharacterized protein n=1 Tax=Tritrichomonas foetus TaxID=1144522 RepID=A0A1J4JLD3_9EUKA|nr:hypothetical protein TRFO_35574 [Tritrichomonas foetus]|eukprot:OHS98076.1 hypothetical protein TRFO_35574 [Tritrichomonas foetus]